MKKITLVTCAVMVAVFSANILTAMDVYADTPADPPGNNGTLKLHEQGTPAGTESNDSHACVFNFEGYQFDDSQQGQIRIEVQGGPQNGTEVLGPIPFGAANANGDVVTAYVNDGVSGFSLDNGHYKATLYGKNGEVLNGNKAKSKVFWVDCPAKAPTATVLAGACILPGAANGVATGSVTNTDDPTNNSVIYTITATGPVTKSTTVTVADGATEAFSLSGLSAGSYTVTIRGNDGTSASALSFVITVCDTPVTPTAPTKKDICGTANDTYTIPSQPGVTYYVDGVLATAGSHVATGTVVITAVANMGYVITQGATTSWTFSFGNIPCIVPVTPTAPTKDDVCGRQNDKYTIPSQVGVTYYVNGVEKPAGTHDAPLVALIVAVPKQGYIFPLHTQSIWLFTYTNKQCPQPCQPTQILRTLTFFNNHHNDVDCIPVSVTPDTPTVQDKCGTSQDTFTIPQKAGVVYKVNGSVVTAGIHPVVGGSVKITAEATNGYAIAQGATAVWEFYLTNNACPTPLITAIAVCSQTGVLVTLTNSGDGDGVAMVNGDAVAVAANTSVDVTVPYTLFKATVLVNGVGGSVLIDKAFDCTPGRGSITPPVVKTDSPAPVAELPMTGSAVSPIQLIIMLLLAVTTYGATYYLQDRISFISKK